ncbi:sn-glycerol-3-phosphate ABC transporter ATP-binding protein UgpC [Sedimentitalea sp. JM2-8]|uniref:Sn-glycerol-3-phosphate ABC transporter ATP-binding protein UgpC n=1 Tax=Sedimentitalea xiamensis TaxID=3050037 RepID=A0ABT7FC45_9RHOB|nr:sn-glycerol-3-phosphate ABC transporter ATP-binding protein UgpC [Sedimentitalea xiamensis]MDK3072686.1 sn-glycerol-3-phosphate ABC transporter ATP-binding protein UgpC [Sedimentitalea xiamensis]
MATLTLRNVKKRFGATEVIHGVDIDVDDGEFIVIVGPSGCGKSTLLRMVAGLETVTSGKIAIDGRRVNDLEPMDRDIAMVFQNYALYPHMSVFDNISYGLKIAKMPKEEIAERVAVAAKMLQLEPYLSRRPRELSGGQRQRVAMGRAIVRKPSVFLFDEPLSNLDAKLRVQMRLEIKALQKDLGITSLYVTHDQVEAMTLADRMIVMNAGVADQIGKPLDVYANPATEFVAGFIGSPATNFVPPAAVAGAPSGAARLGIRPEHARLTDAGSGRMQGVVTFSEALGAETLIHLVLPSGAPFTVRQDGALPRPVEGEPCGIDWPDGADIRFDADGRRIALP